MTRHSRRFVEDMKRGRFTPDRVADMLIEYFTEEVGMLSEEIDAVAEDETQRLKSDIMHHRIPVADNSEEYAAWKRRTLGHDTPLVRTGEYADSIRDEKIRDGLHHIGVPDEEHSSGIRLPVLSAILENGTTDGIPPRPHLRPAERRAGRRIVELIRKFRSRQKITAARRPRKV